MASISLVGLVFIIVLSETSAIMKMLLFLFLSIFAFI